MDLKSFRFTFAFLIAAFAVFSACEKRIVPIFDKSSAWDYLVKQVAFGPRTLGSKAHSLVVEMIKQELTSHGWEVRLQRFSLRDPYGEDSLSLVNIWASLNKKAKKRVLLAAHFDTRPMADREEADSLRDLPIPGANDGASGVAVLLELARALAKRPPQIGVDMIFFDGEDYGRPADLRNYLLGSRYFASQLSAEVGGYHPACGILLDMVGSKEAQIFQELNSLANAPEIARAIFERAKELNLGIFVAKRGQAIYDDHIPLLAAGIKTVDLIDTNYKYWHTLADTPDKCSQETLEQVGILLEDFLHVFPF